MITRLPNEKWEPILGGTSSCTTFWLLCSCLSSIRRPRSLKNTFHHTYLPTNIYFQKISISVLWGALRKTYCIWIDETEQSTYGSHQKGIWCCSLHTAGWCNQWFWYLCVVLFCFESSRKVTKMTKFWYFGRLASNESQNLLEIKEQHWIFPKKWNFVQIIVMCCSNQECCSICVDKVKVL